MIGIYCQGQMKYSQRLSGHSTAYCKLLALSLPELEARLEIFSFSRRDEIGTEYYNV